jgi:hypothetical protein
MLTYATISILAVVLTFLFDRVVGIALLVPILSALCTSVLTQVFAFVQLGHLDPFFLIAFFASFLLGLLVSAITLSIIRKWQISEK